MNKLEDLGWSIRWARDMEKLDRPEWIPGRIVREGRRIHMARTADGTVLAEVSGRFRHLAGERADYPAIGDWVALQVVPDEKRALIQNLLPRRTCLSRKVAGETTEEQVLAANVDVIFLVSGLDGGRSLNVSRIERFLPLVYECGAAPVVVLNKADLCDEAESRLYELSVRFPGIPMHSVSATKGTRLEELRVHIVNGATAVLLGPSGVGKSALINALSGNVVQTVGEVREKDRRGRHTTTRRELFELPGGGAIIDTPGIREIQLWADEESVDDAFDDIVELAAMCRFRDCRHENEPGCAVQQALADERLDLRRFENYLQLRKEAAFLERKKDVRSRLEHQRKWKQIAQLQRHIKKEKSQGRNGRG